VSVKKKDTSVQCENLTGVHVRVRACCEGGAGGECVCERVCMSVRVYVCMRARVCAYIYMCTHTHTCMHVCVYVCACMCVCVACTCVCMYVYVCVRERYCKSAFMSYSRILQRSQNCRSLLQNIVSFTALFCKRDYHAWLRLVGSSKL